MSQELYPYYEKELIAIRRLADEFAKQYPAAANRLMLEANRSTDPHVERMLEGFALLAGRVHMKLDDDFPELTDALLSVLYPHYLTPVPSCGVMQFVADPTRVPLLDGFEIPRESRLFTTAAVDDVQCRYRTVYPVWLWPLAITAARLHPPPFPTGIKAPTGTTAVLKVSLQCEAGAVFSKLSIDELRFHLVGENQNVAELYELLLNHVIQIDAIDPEKPAKPVSLPASAFQAVGFGEDEGLVPYPQQSFPGYRLLTEFFAYPAKFWFLDLKHLDRLVQAGFGSKVDIIIYLRRSTANLEAAVNTGTLRTSCTPVVNLFEQTAEPIVLTMAATEYRVIPEVAHPLGYEVYSIDEVSGVEPSQGINVKYNPFYSVTHAEGRGNPEAYWYATRKQATRENDRGTEVFLQVVDRSWSPTMPAVSTLIVHTTCMNRNLPSSLARAGDKLKMDLEMAAPLAEIKCVRSPTMPLRPPRRKGGHWRLLSHLSLNHLSLAEGEDARIAFQEILRIYDFSDPAVGQQLADVNRFLVDGLIGLTSRRVVGRVDDPVASGFCRGTEITIHLDEEKYVGTGSFLFASVLERFFALYATINSFTQLIAKSRDGKGVIKAWPPRAGAKPLV